jgi:hypothetical protein
VPIKKDGVILVDPVAEYGDPGPAPSPYLQPGPALAEAVPAAPPPAVVLSAEHEAELNRRVAANILAQFAPPPPPVDPATQAEIDRLAAISAQGLPPLPDKPVYEMGNDPDVPTLVTPDGVEDCTGCGHPNPASQKFCGECGARVEKIPKWSCGHDNSETAKFCGECGAKAYTRPAWSDAQSATQDHAVITAARPKPESQLTPEERAERQRQHNEAIRMGSRDLQLPPEPARTDRTVMIHFLEDGITFAGQVWYRGQEIELDTDSERYQQQGRFWMHMTDTEQWNRWGKVMFRTGPWPGKRLTEIQPQMYQSLSAVGGKDGARTSGPSAEELAQAEQMEARRRRGVQPMPRL